MRLLLVTITLLMIDSAAADDADYYLLRYLPSVNWQERVSYEEQPGLAQHHKYLRELHITDRLAMGGQLRDRPDVVVLLRAGSMQEARQIVADDPGIQADVIQAELSRWEVEMSSLRLVRRKPESNKEGRTYLLKRTDPESRLYIT